MNRELIATTVLQYAAMPLEAPPESASYRVTLFFGPEPVDGQADVQACVFNVKKRNWKAGIQVTIEISSDQIASLRDTLRLPKRLAQAFESVNEEERPSFETRGGEYFVQALCRCKLDLCLRKGLVQENQRVSAGQLNGELTQDVKLRQEYVFSYIFTELDLVPHGSPPT